MENICNDLFWFNSMQEIDFGFRYGKPKSFLDSIPYVLKKSLKKQYLYMHSQFKEKSKINNIKNVF